MKTAENWVREIMNIPWPMMGKVWEREAVAVVKRLLAEAVEDRDIEIRALRGMIEQRDQARIDAVYRKAERIRQAKSECKEWDTFSKEEMWDTIQRIRNLTGNDGTESIEDTVEKLIAKRECPYCHKAEGETWICLDCEKVSKIDSPKTQYCGEFSDKE